jgi:dTDP-4-dehydrorhamnose reductase
MAQKKRVVILGASGLIGSELALLLKKRGYTVLAPAQKDLDIRDTEAVEKYIVRAKPHVVVNAVGLLNVEAIEKDPLPAWQVNALGAGNVARAVAKNPGIILVHISTSHVFDGTKAFYVEDEGTKPLTVYGYTKMIGDTLVRHYCGQSQTKYHIVRASWLYGARRPTFVDVVLKTLQGGEIFEASVDQRGNPTYVVDFVEAIFSNFLKTKKHGSGFFYIGNETQKKGVSRYDIALEIAKTAGVPTALVKKATSKKVFTTPRPSVSLLNTKLPPLRDWREGLHEYLYKFL